MDPARPLLSRFMSSDLGLGRPSISRSPSSAIDKTPPPLSRTASSQIVQEPATVATSSLTIPEVGGKLFKYCNVAKVAAPIFSDRLLAHEPVAGVDNFDKNQQAMSILEPEDLGRMATTEGTQPGNFTSNANGSTRPRPVRRTTEVLGTVGCW